MAYVVVRLLEMSVRFPRYYVEDGVPRIEELEMNPS